MTTRGDRIKAEVEEIILEMREACYGGRPATEVAHEAMARLEAVRVRHGIGRAPGGDPYDLPGFADTAGRLSRVN